MIRQGDITDADIAWLQVNRAYCSCCGKAMQTELGTHWGPQFNPKTGDPMSLPTFRRWVCPDSKGDDGHNRYSVHSQVPYPLCQEQARPSPPRWYERLGVVQVSR